MTLEEFVAAAIDRHLSEYGEGVMGWKDRDSPSVALAKVALDAERAWKRNQIMGKVDDQRKMREANFEQRRRAKIDPSLLLPGVAIEVVGPVEAISYGKENYPELFEKCGHKGIGGKTCTRPKDHTEKNHRYK